MSRNHKDLSDKQLCRACRQIEWILGTSEPPEIVAAWVAAMVETYYAVHIQNRSKVKNPRQYAKRPHFTREQIFDLLVLIKLEEEEKRQEIPGHGLTHADWIKRLCKHLVKHSLTHTSYYAAVAVGRILCTYSASEVGKMYWFVAHNRATTKLDAECGRTKNNFRRSLESRFVGMPREILFKDGPADRLPRSNWQVSLIADALKCLAPHSSIFSDGYLWKPDDEELLPIEDGDLRGDSVIEVDRMSLIFRTEQFNEFAKAAQLKLFDECVKKLRNWWPDPADPNSGGTKDGASGGQYNVQEIRDRVAHQRKRRRRISPGSLAIRVDGFDCATIRGSEMEHKTILDDATIVEIVGRDDEGDVVLATYILTYEDQPRTEEWTADLPGSRKLLCSFEYDEDDRVRATFTLTDGKRLGSAALPSNEHSTSGMAGALSSAWLKARIVLNFAGVLTSVAVLLAVLIYANWAMSPRFAARVAPIAAEVNPMAAITRVVEIFTDRSLNAATRSVAERSRQQIMSDFRIKQPSYDSQVDERQVVRGTTPFPGLRYYIIVTTPQGQDFVSSEAAVSGDSWEGVATFGSAGVGGGEKFYVRVIATKARLSEGPFSGTADAISSDSIPVIRRP
jgi:hypothetical protein